MLANCFRGRGRKSAFSLLELVGVLAVIAIIACFLVPVMVRRADRAAWIKENTTLSSMAPLQLQVVGEQHRRHHCDKNSSAGSAGCDHQIKRGEPARIGPKAIQFAMAHHAANEKRPRIHRHLFLDGQITPFDQSPAKGSHRPPQQHRERHADVPTR